MAATVTVEVKGLKELGERMRKLGTKVATKTSSSATSAAARVIARRMRANIDKNPSIDTGSLRKSVIVKKIPKSQTRLTSEHIATFRGRGKPYNKKGQVIARAPHAHLLEFGTVHMRAEPIMRPAYDQGKGEALKEMTERLRRSIEKAEK